MTEEQIKHMVERFLTWRLPDNFNPDGGISFKRTFNEFTAHPVKAEPTGTNLFDAAQAEEMVRNMITDMPQIGSAPDVATAIPGAECLTGEPIKLEKGCTYVLQLTKPFSAENFIAFRSTLTDWAKPKGIDFLVLQDSVALLRETTALSADTPPVSPPQAVTG